MTWAALRLQRTETLVTAAIVAIVAAALVPVGLHMASVYDNEHLAQCIGALKNGSCGPAIGDFLQRFEGLNGFLSWFNLIPGIVGVMLAAPLLLELESGTFRFAWTQGVTRRRWIAGKLGIAVAVALLAMLVFSQLVTWYRGPLDQLQGRMDSSSLDFEGTVAFGYVLFALALALIVGILVRRTAMAVIVGFVTYVVSRLFVDGWLRQRLLTPTSTTWLSRTQGPDLNRDWVISSGPSDRFGHFLVPTFHATVAAPCAKGQPCFSVTEFPPSKYMHAIYFPASRFWALQSVETALFGGVALALILFAAWWIKERVA